jgi:hypothetical protein
MMNWEAISTVAELVGAVIWQEPIDRKALENLH